MKLLNSDRFFLKGTNQRFIHVATVQDGLHEYVYLFDTFTKKNYIEELTTCGLEYIKDDRIVEEINNFLFEKNVTNLKYGDFSPDKPETD